MRALAFVALAACSSAPAVRPVEHTERAAPIDAAVAIVDPPDATVERVKVSTDPLDRLPATGEPALSVSPSDAELDARYALATQHASEAVGLAMLLEMARTVGGSAVDRARWDDAWQPQWSSTELRLILRIPDVEGGDDDDDDEGEDEPLACPSGTQRKQTGGTEWCERKGGVKHGPYYSLEGDPDSDSGQIEEAGEYADGLREGPWSFSYEGAGQASFGAYRHDRKHGIWEEQDGYNRSYHVYVDGKRQGVELGFADDRDDVVTSERWYQDDVLHGAFVERATFEPYDVERTGSYEYGAKHGEWKVLRHDTLRAVQHWTRDVPDGRFAYYDAKGNVLADVTIDQGTGDWVEYDPDWGLRAEGALVDNVEQGVWGEAELLSDRWATGAYVDGLRDGRWTYTDRRGGNVEATGSFAAGKADGTWVIYEDGGKRTLQLDHGKLVKLDGKKPTKAQRSDFAHWDPMHPLGTR